MPGINELLLPRDDSEREQDMIESLVLSVQIAIQHEMRVKGISQMELAKRLGVTAARVSQILAGNGSSLTLKTIGRIAHALDERFDLVTHRQAIELEGDRRIRR